MRPTLCMNCLTKTNTNQAVKPQKIYLLDIIRIFQCMGICFVENCSYSFKEWIMLCHRVGSLNTFEPPRGKTKNVVSEQVRHKPACTSTEELEA